MEYYSLFIKILGLKDILIYILTFTSIKELLINEYKLIEIFTVCNRKQRNNI